MDNTKRITRLLRTGRPDHGWVNVPPNRASTFVFDSVAAWKDTRARRERERLPSYGARGNDTGHALEDALVELEHGHRCFLFPTGQAAIASTLLAFLSPGDHILLSDAVYEPVRNFCKNQLAALGIEYSFYAPNGQDIESKLKANTRILYVESPGTMTYDMVDLPHIASTVKNRDIVIVADNTWGSGWLYQPLSLGADISIMATTKYVGGHSDLMMGAAVANEKTWQQLQKSVIGLGQTASPDDAFLALRGLRTMPMRLQVHGDSAMRVAQWLNIQPEISKVFFPALKDDENHALWKRDCSGMNGLISVEFHKKFSREDIERMIDALNLFGLGASWGGFESLVIPADLAGTRALSDWSIRGTVVRFHIGLEDPVDLIEDLKQALSVLHVRMIDAALLKDCLHDGKEIALLDVREQGQFGERHLFLANPLPFSRLEIEIGRLVPRKTCRIVLVDDKDSGIAMQAARRLSILGYVDISVLSEGVDGWAAAGFETFAGVNVPSKAFGELAEHAFHTPRISASELNKLLDAQDDVITLDGRPFSEYQKMNIPGSYCCPNGELALRVDDLVKSPNTTIVVNCAGRTRSIIGAQTLINLGLPNPIFALENGTQGWYLEDLQLEHGASRHYVQPPKGEALLRRQARAQKLAESYEISFVDADVVNAWRCDPSRTTYLCDVRTSEEIAAKPIVGAQSTPGGQLIQATDQYVATRGARLVLIDSENVRAPVVATWLSMLGWEVAVLSETEAANLSSVQEVIDNRLSDVALHTVTARDISSLIATGALLCDVRSSMDYRAAHLTGARWAIRPHFVSILRSYQTCPQSLVLIATDLAVAKIIAQEAYEQGVLTCYVCLEGPSHWSQTGMSIEKTPEQPPDSECIDYLFFVHDRHDGNKAAARQYLAWETNLLSQIDDRERAIFKLP